MKRIVTALCALLLALAVHPAGAFATSLSLTGAGQAASGGGGGGYTGPGDIVGSAKAFYGLRAYNATLAAAGTTKAVKIVRASDSQTCDLLIATSGDLGNTANCSGAGNGTAAATFCNATTCTIDTWYDQVGGFNATNGTVAQQPVLTFSCVNSKPCAVFTGSSSQFVEATTSTNTVQPLTVSAVAIRTGTFTSQNDILSGANGVWFDSSANHVGGWFSGSSTVTASDSAWHALQFVITGASSTINVDGTSNAASGMGTGDLSADYYLGAQSGSSFLTGKITEVGVWPATFNSTQQTNMCHNQFTYWGTSTSC